MTRPKKDREAVRQLVDKIWSGIEAVERKQKAESEKLGRAVLTLIEENRAARKRKS